jgi:hypothetical protein
MDITYLNPTGVAELYTDDTETPVGWERKLTEMRRGTEYRPTYSSYDVFDPKDENTKITTKSCRTLSVLKNIYCKEVDSYSCNRSTPEHQLKTKHDMLMKCRNIRAIENKANCYYPKVGWLTPDETGHEKEIVDMGNGALKCLKEQRVRNSGKKMQNQHVPARKPRKSARRYRSVKKDPKKRRNSSGKVRVSRKYDGSQRVENPAEREPLPEK